MKALALLFIAATLSAQVQPAPGHCAMAHCNNQMTDFSPVTPPGIGTGMSVVNRDASRLGVAAGLACVSNGTNVACAYRESPDAVVYYDADGNVLWTSGNLLDDNTYKNTPIIQTDGSVVIGDDQHLIKFNQDGSVAWSTATPEGAPISQITTPNGAIFTATHPVAVDTCSQDSCNLMVTLNNSGSQYTSAKVTLTGGDCAGATATAAVAGGGITAITVTSQGANCYIAPDVIITGDGSGAQANAQLLAPAPISAYNGTTGALVGSLLLYSSGTSGPYYETINVPCVNNGSYPNRVYISTNLSVNSNQGALWAVDIDPANLANPISPAWSVTFDGPSGASPLCIGNNVYFDGAGFMPGDNAGTTIFGVQDNGSSATMLFHVSLGAGTEPVTCNFAMDPRAVGGFWHEIQYDPNIYHRDGTNGSVIETLDVNSLLAASGAPPATYWMSGVFNTVGTPDHPYMILPESDVNYVASYLTLVDITDSTLIWALPLYPGNSPFFSDSFEGEAAIATNSNNQTVLAMATRYNGAYFLSEGQGTAVLSSTSLSFGDQPQGSSGAAQTVTLTNTASSTLTVTRVTASGDFGETDNCAAPLTPGVACSLAITFTPTALGPRSGALTIASNAAGSPQTISLSGVGITGAPGISLSASALNFPGQVVGTTSSPQVVTMTNSGTALLTIASIVNGGDAIQSSNCSSILAPGAGCSINVMFAAGGVGKRSGTITINSNAAHNPRTITLTGTGLLAQGAAAGLSSTSLVFSGQSLGAAGTPQTVQLVNVGTAPLHITSIAHAGAASETNNCPQSLAATKHCTITVTFTPSATGPSSGTISIADNATGSPQSIAVAGVASGNPVPLLNQAASPADPIVGASGFGLKILGGGFLPGAVVNWNGAPLSTTFVGKTQLTATVPPANAATAGTAWITVVNPTPGGGTSNPYWFPITTPTEWLTLNRTDLASSAGPQALATADFDGNGTLDLLVANSAANSVSVLLGNGNGTFAPPADYSTGAQPVAVAAGDFNNDGKPDIVVANQADNTVSILLGAGGGAFSPGVPYPTGNGPVAVTVADFNGDGNLDLAVANQADNTVSVLLGNGNGTFNAHVDFPAGPSPRALAAGDFNADGKLDLAVANDFTNGSVSVLLGNGDGTLQSAVAYATDDSIALAAADLNGDGILDLAAVNRQAQTLSVLLGNGDGTFQPALRKLLELQPVGFAIGDLNADGTLDVAVANSGENTVSILPGQDNGNYGTARDFAVAAGPVAVVLGDFNGDGSLDLVVAAPASNTVSVLLQAPAITFSSTSLNLGNVILGQHASQVVTLTNTGSAVMTIASIAASGAFTQQNACPATLAPGASCSITATVGAQTKGPLAGLLTITDNVPGSPQTIALSGTAVGVDIDVNLSQTAVDSGNPVSSNTISLTHVAPAGGALVSLSSSNPAVASAPASVTIPGGTMVSPAFTITTAGVEASTPVTLSASFNGVTSTVILTVNPAVLQSLTLSPSSIGAGLSTTANFAALDGQAPPAGAILSLSSANPAVAAVPASVQIAAYAGQSSTFTIATGPVTAPTQVVITASYGKSQAPATLTVNPGSVSLASLSLSPTSVVGGSPPASYTNVAVLSGPAPSGGAAIALSSSNPAVASVQANVQVAAGATTSANFPITTTAVATGTRVTITASYQGVTQQAQIMVNVATPLAVQLSQTSVKGGATVPANSVKMDGPAPSGGLTVSLTSSNPAVAAVPATVTVSPGLKISQTFAIATAAVKSSTAVTISASYHGITQSATLIVTP
ncbi:MAG: FG-GAP-like repeat-containing protein [Bryobacteraceae bacterium]|jgi:hypothetical protein